MARGTPHSAATKAAVLADVLTGMSQSEVARRHGVSRTTVKMWQSQAGGSALVVHEKKQDIGEQVYGFLEELIATLRLQIRASGDEAWIKRQSASELALLIGVECDKAIRLLAAFRSGSDDGGS